MRLIKINFLLIAALIINGCCDASSIITASDVNGIRPPATPLITVDPYFCVWSFNDNLNQEATKHWTGKDHPLVGAIRVDGKTYRIMGKEQPKLDVIIPTSTIENWDCKYTNTKPAGDWTAQAFNDGAWKSGQGSFGTKDVSTTVTEWNTKDIWVRRGYDLTEDLSLEDLIMEYSHDDVFELYVNGIEIANTGNVWRDNVQVTLSDEVKKTLKGGKVMIAAHCHNTTGGAYVDFGLFKKSSLGASFDNVAVQKSVNVLPTRTFYTFECPGVEVELIFTAPLLPTDLDLISTPINYLTYQVKATDGKKHDVQIYLEATPQFAVNNDSQPVVTTKENKDGITYLKTGTVAQPVLKRAGDNVRIDWGYFYMAAGDKSGSMAIADYYDAKREFIANGKLPVGEQSLETENMLREMPVLAFSQNLGSVSSKPVSGYIMLGYDDLYSVEYFKDQRVAYWKRDGKTIYEAFAQSAATYEKLMGQCAEFDKKMMSDATAAGGKKYADLCALAYRQAIAAHKLVEDKDGNLLFLSKENNSNGSIGTVDITYPSAPLFLLYNPELVKGMLNHIFNYSESGRWTKPFAAHDVGTYPLANGQTYGGDMPVEESGNMLILSTAISIIEGNADYAKKHWDVLTIWADYLVKEGLDPANQLCTDDFAGHFAHNTNLSIKAIMGIAGYGKMAQMMGKNDVADKYIAEAKAMAVKWVEMANDGDKYRLTFDKTGTWSQKYNIIWDKYFGMDIFPKDVMKTEMAHYLKSQNTYGLPLDSRKTYTKSDWILWTACMTDDAAEFEALILPVYNYANETKTRMPLSDWHETTNGNSVGFRARSVVGGYFMKMMEPKIMAK